MCAECDQMAIQHILTLIDKGYSLDTAIRLARDAVIAAGLSDPEHCKDIDDVRDLYYTVTRAGTTLGQLQTDDPALFEVLLLNNRIRQETTRAQ